MLDSGRKWFPSVLHSRAILKGILHFPLSRGVLVRASMGAGVILSTPTAIDTTAAGAVYESTVHFSAHAAAAAAATDVGAGSGGGGGGGSACGVCNFCHHYCCCSSQGSSYSSNDGCRPAKRSDILLFHLTTRATSATDTSI